MQVISSEETKTRNHLMDNIKGILMISVITAHYLRVGGSFQLSSFDGTVYITAFSFIMQGFLFFSGYFSKNLQKCRDGAVKNFLLPYIIMMPLMFISRYILSGNAELNFFKPSFALWFMLVMFVYRFFLKSIYKIPYIVHISVFLMLISGCIPFLGEELALGRICSFFFFFILGYKCEEKHIEKIRDIPKGIMIIVLIFLGAFSLFMAHGEVWDTEVWQMKECYLAFGMSNFEGIFARLVLAVTALGWIMVLINLAGKKESWLSCIGRNTMTVYLLHIPIRYIIESTGVAGEGNVLYHGILAAAVVLSVYVLSRPVLSLYYNKILYFCYDILIIGAVGKCMNLIHRTYRIAVETRKKYNLGENTDRREGSTPVRYERKSDY